MSLALAVALSLVVSLVTGVSQAVDPPYRIMVFSKTAGFRHDSIPAGIQALRELGAANSFTVDATEDANAFNATNLANYKVVVFLSTTGDVLNATQQTAFESYITGGGNFVGVHAAADTEYNWSFYGGLVGAYFQSHPAGTPQATVRVDDRTHPSTAHLPAAWTRNDEWYNYRTNVRGVAKVLARADESTYSGGTMGSDHPIIWCQNYRGGRSWYTGMGHTQASYTEANFRNQLLGGIRWAAGMVVADCGPTNNPGPILLSRSRPTTASSSENATFGPANAVDGNTGSRWSSLFSDPQWISVDLGSVRSVSRVRLAWEAAYGRAYRIEVSQNNSTWTTVNTTTASDGGSDDIPFTATQARYVRMWGTARATAWGYSLFEFEVYGT